SSDLGFLAIVRQRPVVAFFLINFLLQLTHGPYYTFYSLYLQSAGYGLDVIGLLWCLGVLAEVVLFLLMHRLLARISLRRSEEHTSELQSRENLVCRLLLEKKNKIEIEHLSTCLP